MIAMRRTCLQPDELQRVIQGELSPEAFDSALSHLDSCETCRSAIETLESSSSEFQISHLVDRGDDASRVQNETACQIALQGLLKGPPPISTPTAPPPFDMLGPYRLLELIGSGGMGAVYLAEHQRLKRQCAIKLLPPEKVLQPGWLDRFDREMTTIASLEHPHIVSATDAGHKSGWHYLVMEHLDGLDIGRIAQRMGQLELPDACEIVRQSALGLSHIHESGLVHRDIKPSNLMLTRSGKIKLLDLGLVLDGDDPLSKDDRLTTVGHVMGTMPYMAPEQLADSRDVRPQSDIYSLGATLYRLIAGHPPHQGGRGLASQVLAITSHDARPLDSVREDVDREVVSLVAKMLDRNPEKRPQSAAEVANRLTEMTAGNQLQRLVRTALKKPGDDQHLSTILPSIGPSGGSNRSISWRSWVAGGFFAALILVAAIVFKIHTDVGTIVVHSEEQSLTVVIRQNEEVVERLTIEPGEGSSKTLRKGTYQIDIEGGGEALVLSDEVVTIGRGTTQRVQVHEKQSAPETLSVAKNAIKSDMPATQDTVATPEGGVVVQQGGMAEPLQKPDDLTDYPITLSAGAENLLFQGKDLATWMNVLERERDVQSIGNAMKAVELLTRDADPKKRIEAAKQTVVVARRLGGLVVGSSINEQNPSHAFMREFLDLFVRYFPNLGFDVVADELASDYPRSKMALIFATNNFLNGIVDHAEYPNQVRLAQQWFEETKRLPDAVEQVMPVCDLLVSAGEEFSADAKKGSLNELASQMAHDAAIDLMLRLDLKITGRPALVEYTKNRLNLWLQSRDSEHHFGQMSISGSNVIAAIQLALADEEYGTDERWQSLADLTTGASVLFRNEEFRLVYRAIEQHAPQALLKSIERNLETQITGNQPDRLKMMLISYAKHHPDLDEVQRRFDEVEQLIEKARSLSQSGLGWSQTHFQTFQDAAGPAKIKLEERRAFQK